MFSTKRICLVIPNVSKTTFIEYVFNTVKSPIILFLISMLSGKRPRSPYNIQCGVLFLTFNICFRKSV